MVGSGASSDRSKEAVGMMALHEALRNVCLNSDWIYSVFWTIRPRPRVRGGNGCKVGDDNGSLMLMWEDGYCRGRAGECLDEINSEEAVRKAFSKMSIQLYNYGEGLMGKVASDKCHKWVFKEPAECEPNISNYWQSSFDALPPEWTDQFETGIQTIAVIQAGHGLLQLGSCKIIPEDLHFVLRMRHTFESLGYQSGFYLSQLFSSTSNAASTAGIPVKQPAFSGRSPALFNWGSRPLYSANPTLEQQQQQQQSCYQNAARLGIPQTNDETRMFLHPHSSSESRMEDMMGDHEADIKWPNGLTFFNALTGRNDDCKVLFNHDSSMGGGGGGGGGGPKPEDQNPDPSGLQHGENPNEFLTLDSHGGSGDSNARKMDNNNNKKYKRSYTLPSRMTSSASSTSLYHQNPGEYRNEGAGGMYSDVMETFLE